eukprot:gnl/MRDRNA2_/MRDRNA2_118774_c0_seq1.p1 gnl/MRDRNA2_/MRDRNA2_118774_c0~~gnl/MRDRNA2_/MRDRNA2_118774_c0_seq1.p1  ORF type:complete len:271 (-),score=66.94 gnl/MRDRNA2_/MRDRNA2_118774_c0_seq1:14-826(-)
MIRQIAFVSCWLLSALAATEQNAAFSQGDAVESSKSTLHNAFLSLQGASERTIEQVETLPANDSQAAKLHHVNEHNSLKEPEAQVDQTLAREEELVLNEDASQQEVQDARSLLSTRTSRNRGKKRQGSAGAPNACTKHGGMHVWFMKFDGCTASAYGDFDGDIDEKEWKMSWEKAAGPDKEMDLGEYQQWADGCDDAEEQKMWDVISGYSKNPDPSGDRSKENIAPKEWEDHMKATGPPNGPDNSPQDGTVDFKEFIKWTRQDWDWENPR